MAGMHHAGGGGKIKKAQYYVWYLGWKECRGVYGREHTEPIAKELVHRRRNEMLPKLTIEVSKRELKIVQLVEKRPGKSGGPPAKVDKVRYPPVPAKDVTYAVQALSPDEDVVACIYLGYNPQTGCAVHVHVYRCDSPETGAMFVNHLNQLIALPEHMRRVEKIEAQLVAKKQVVPRPRNISENDFDALSTMTPDTDDGNTYESRSENSDPSDYAYQSRGFDDPYNHPPSRQHPPSQQPPYHSHPHSHPQQQQPKTPQDGDHIRHHPRHHQPKPQQPYHTNEPQYYQQNHQQKDTDYEPQPAQTHKKEELYQQQTDIYDNLTAELKNKLGVKNEKLPILLPPKDYDTLHRSVGNLNNIETRRSQNANIVGIPKGPGSDRSQGSSSGKGKGRDERGVDYERPPQRDNHAAGANNTHPPHEGDNLRNVVPHWKSHGQYVPPSTGPGSRHDPPPPTSQQPPQSSARPTSPAGPIMTAGPYPRKESPRRGRALSPQRAMSPNRAMSPGRGGKPTGVGSSGARPMSPPPDLGRDSYFQSDDPLPGYLPDDRFHHSATRPAKQRAEPDRYASHDQIYTHGGHRPVHEDDPVYTSNKKYTASTLGLLENNNTKPRSNHGRNPPPSSSNPRSDEGYRSMDRHNPYGDYGSMDRGRVGYGGQQRGPNAAPGRAGDYSGGGDPHYRTAPPKSSHHGAGYSSDHRPFKDGLHKGHSANPYHMATMDYYP